MFKLSSIILLVAISIDGSAAAVKCGGVYKIIADASRYDTGVNSCFSNNQEPAVRDEALMKAEGKLLKYAQKCAAVGGRAITTGSSITSEVRQDHKRNLCLNIATAKVFQKCWCP